MSRALSKHWSIISQSNLRQNILTKMKSTQINQIWVTLSNLSEKREISQSSTIDDLPEIHSQPMETSNGMNINTQKSHCHNIINDFIEQVSTQVAGSLWFNTLHIYDHNRKGIIWFSRISESATTAIIYANFGLCTAKKSGIRVCSVHTTNWTSSHERRS